MKNDCPPNSLRWENSLWLFQFPAFFPNKILCLQIFSLAPHLELNCLVDRGQFKWVSHNRETVFFAFYFRLKCPFSSLENTCRCVLNYFLTLSCVWKVLVTFLMGFGGFRVQWILKEKTFLQWKSFKLFLALNLILCFIIKDIHKYIYVERNWNWRNADHSPIFIISKNIF